MASSARLRLRTSTQRAKAAARRSDRYGAGARIRAAEVVVIVLYSTSVSKLTRIIASDCFSLISGSLEKCFDCCSREATSCPLRHKPANTIAGCAAAAACVFRAYELKPILMPDLAMGTLEVPAGEFNRVRGYGGEWELRRG